MSTEQGKGSTSQKAAYDYSDQPARQGTSSTPASTPSKLSGDDQTASPATASPHDERGKSPPRDQPSESTQLSTEDPSRPRRQVIAVSASKGPAAFFNLARKFLVTDEMCDLSALEGAIVSAVDAAHLLERSKLAKIVRVQTSYVTVEPKRRRPAPPSSPRASASPGIPPTYVSSSSHAPQTQAHSTEHQQQRRSTSGRELRRARIIITVQRTESYKTWLEENPLQAIIAGDGEEELAEGGGEGTATEGTPAFT